MEALSEVLWKQRELMELLVYKLETEQLVLASGRSRWLPQSSRETAAVSDQLQASQLLVATESLKATESLGLAPDASLKDIAELAPEPWGTLLLDHRDAMIGFAAEIAEKAASNEQLLANGRQLLRERVVAQPAGDGYSADGTSAPSAQAAGGRLFDRSM